jgi:hypothetical protein
MPWAFLLFSLLSNCRQQAIARVDLCQDLVRQLDSVRVFGFAFVFLGKNLFEPTRLLLCDCLVYAGGIMKDDELLTATITSEGAHLLEVGRSLSRLTFLDRYSLHALTFYLSAHSSLRRHGILPEPEDQLQ